MNKLKKFAILLTSLTWAFSAVVPAISFTPTTIVQAAREPYCFVSYSDELGCYVVDYYYYDASGVAIIDREKRLILDGSTLRTGRGDIISTNFKPGSTVSWYNSNTAVWQNKNDNFFAWNSTTKKNTRIATSGEKVLLNYDQFANQIKMKNGKTVSISTLIKEVGSGYGTGSDASSDSSSINSGKEVVTKTDSATRKVTVTFGNHSLVSYRAEVTYNGKYKLSEYCKSGIRYLAVTKNGSGYYIFVYEDDDNKIYRFDTADICNPIEVDFRGEIKSSPTFDSKGYGNKLITSVGSFSFSSLTEKADEDNSTTKAAYAINKSTYSMLYKSNGERSQLKRKGSALYEWDLKIADGIKAKKRQFGFWDEKTITYILNGNRYIAPLSNPSKSTLAETNVKELIPAKDGSGFMIGAK